MPAGRRSSFTSIVEIFPPVFSTSVEVEPVVGVPQKTRDFVERVRRIKHLADSFLIADVMDPARMKLPTVLSASILRDRLGVDAIPVITTRDSNRTAVISSLLAAFSHGLTGVMLVWGDRYKEGGPRNVYDFKSLSEVIGLAKSLADRSGSRCRFLAPVNLQSLKTKKGRTLAKDRLSAGADFLLAQPPTADSMSTMQAHLRLVRNAGLEGRVLLNVFPFRDGDDIDSCKVKFGWELPNRLYTIGQNGEGALLAEAKKVAKSIERSGLPGVYVTTRGRPEVARFILG